jgi:hypothetical protein
MKMIALTAFALASATAALAAPITYTLSGVGGGAYVDFADPTMTIHGFAPEAISFIGEGDTAGAASGGVERVPLVAGQVLGLFGNAFIPVGAESVFAVSATANTASFGDYGGVTDSPSVLFHGLGAYDGVSSLESTPVTDVTFKPFPVYAGGHYYGVEFTSFTGATFSASVPEPAAWALILVGFGSMGAGLRVTRRKSTAARLY